MSGTPRRRWSVPDWVTVLGTVLGGVFTVLGFVFGITRLDQLVNRWKNPELPRSTSPQVETSVPTKSGPSPADVGRPPITKNTDSPGGPTPGDQKDSSLPPNPNETLGPITRRTNSKDGLSYVWIPQGTFQMGCSEGDQACQKSEKPAHVVTITRGFWMGETEVTQRAYQMVAGNNPSRFRGDDLPVESLTWGEAQRYCEQVGIRLPTEAEWEYAARGGSLEPRYGNIDLIAWYQKNSKGRTHSVGTQPANGFGLKDMLGNVAEWTADWYAPYLSSAVDPAGPTVGSRRVVRGESWGGPAHWVRASARGDFEPSSRSNILGVRCVGELP